MRQIMKKILCMVIFFSLSNIARAETIPFNLSIKGGSIDVSKMLELSDVDEGKTKINFDFKDNSGKKYNFDLKYKKITK